MLGWKERGLTASPELWKRINRGGGWLHPVVLADGLALGTWSSQRTSARLRLEVRPFSRLEPAARRALAAEASDVAAFLGVSAGLVLQ